MYIYAIKLPGSTKNNNNMFQSRQETLGHLAQYRADIERNWAAKKSFILFILSLFIISYAIRRNDKSSFVLLLLELLILKPMITNFIQGVQPSRREKYALTTTNSIASAAILGAFPNDLIQPQIDGGCPITVNSYFETLIVEFKNPTTEMNLKPVVEQCGYIWNIPEQQRFTFNVPIKVETKEQKINEANNEKPRILFLVSDLPTHQAFQDGISTTTSLKLYEDLVDAVDELSSRNPLQMRQLRNL